jgi:hypothetical protein
MALASSWQRADGRGGLEQVLIVRSKRLTLVGVRGLILAAAIAAAFVTFVAGSAIADPPTPANPAGNPNGDILGVVPSHDQGPPSKGGGGGGGGNNLVYHNGPVLHSNTAYAIYWNPPGSSTSPNYKSVIDGFFGNVAAASGSTSNVYFSDTQYYDGSGNIAYSSAFLGSVVDTTAFPANGCTDSYTSVCLSDAQLRAEIDNVASAQHWPRGLGSIFFIFTPKNVGSCFGSSCAFSYFCAYHSSFPSSSGTTLYANQPYAASVPAACGSGQSPNNDDADSTINVLSHEHNETITDPLGSAWYDRRGAENGDKCAWTFGTALGGTTGQKYNQVINGGRYYLQQEWSNHSSGCVLTGT